MGGFSEIVSIIIGRYLFGKIGYFVRKGWLNLIKNISKESRLEGENNEDIDIDDFKNRIVGFVFISTFIIILMLLRHYF